MARKNRARYRGRERQHRASRRKSPAEVRAEVLQMERCGVVDRYSIAPIVPYPQIPFIVV